MSKTWVVVGSRTGARIFEHAGPGRGLALLRSVDHPEGRKLSSEIDTDRSGRTFNKASHGAGGAPGHSMDREVAAHDQEAVMFARSLASTLREGRMQNACGRIVLVAEPRFLGMLRDALDAQTSKLVSDSVAKDLANVEQRDLGPHLESVLAV